MSKLGLCLSPRPVSDYPTELLNNAASVPSLTA